MAWGSTNKNKLNQFLRHQKHAFQIIFFKEKLTHAKPLLQSINALNIYQLNIFQILLFMYKVKKYEKPQIFRTVFYVTNKKYNSQWCRRLTFPKPLYKTTQCNIFFRGPYLWKNYLSQYLNQNSVFWYYQRSTVLL